MQEDDIQMKKKRKGNTNTDTNGKEEDKQR